MTDSTQTKAVQEHLLEVAAKEAAGLYWQVVIAATAFLWVSLFVIEKWRPPEVCSVIFMVVGGISLCITIAAIAHIRWRNLCSLRLIAEGEFYEARRCDNHNRRLTRRAIALLGVGMLSMALAAIAAIIQ